MDAVATIDPARRAIIVGQSALQHQEQRFGVGVEHPVPLRLAGVEDGLRDDRRGVAHHAVDAAEGLLGAGEDAVDIGARRDVGRDRDDLAVPGEIGDRGIDIGRADARPRRAQLFDRCLADAPRGAADDHPHSGQARGHGRCPPSRRDLTPPPRRNRPAGNERRPCRPGHRFVRSPPPDRSPRRASRAPGRDRCRPA